MPNDQQQKYFPTNALLASKLVTLKDLIVFSILVIPNRRSRPFPYERCTEQPKEQDKTTLLTAIDVSHRIQFSEALKLVYSFTELKERDD